MADAGLTPKVKSAADFAGLAETLIWAQGVRADPDQTITAYLLADELIKLIEQTRRLLAISQEQLDRCNAEAAA